MRAWVVAIALVAACKGKDKSGSAEAVKTALVAPKVAVGTVLAKNDKPPILFLLDNAGMVRLGAAPTWAALDAHDVTISTKVTPVDQADLYVREAFAFGKDPVEAVKAWDTIKDTDVDLSSLEDVSTRPANTQDDPPPPEPEDDGSEESGGTGTAITLEEGKMGKKDSDRAEGQYKMMKAQEDPVLARQQAIEQARAAGVLGPGASGANLPYGSLPKPAPKEDGQPTRVAEVEGVVPLNGQLDRLKSLVVIDPAAKATRLIAFLNETGAAVAVAHEGKLRPLALHFNSQDYHLNESWVEVNVSATGLVVEAVPDAQIAVSDPKQLAEAIAKARSARGTSDDVPVDVLVAGDVDVQRLIDVVVALHAAGIKTIGLGAIPPPAELARRGHRISSLRFGQPNAQGDLDKALIRKVIKQSRPQLQACYDSALAANPGIGGVVSTQFFITPNGTVAAAAASGIDPTLATCVADVIKKLEFPKPKGGGGVQVNYPFMMRP